MNDAIVRITDVYPDATEIPVTELRDTDRVYDAMGNTHGIVKGGVRHLKNGLVKVKRDDLDEPEYFEADKTITVQR